MFEAHRCFSQANLEKTILLQVFLGEKKDYISEKRKISVPRRSDIKNKIELKTSVTDDVT